MFYIRKSHSKDPHFLTAYVTGGQQWRLKLEPVTCFKLGDDHVRCVSQVSTLALIYMVVWWTKGIDGDNEYKEKKDVHH